MYYSVAGHRFCINASYMYTYYSVAGRKISYSMATLSYNNYYTNLRDYDNSLISDLLQHYGKYHLEL